MNNPIYQEKAIHFIKHYLNEGVMIPIYGQQNEFDTNAFLQCQLIPVADVEKELETDDTNRWHSLNPGFTVHGVGENDEVIYHRFGGDNGTEPLVIKRDYDGLGVEGEIEISEEFRLLNNLYFVRTKNEYLDLENDTVVIKIQNDLVSIHKRYLTRFLAVKEMALLVHCDSRYFMGVFDTSIKLTKEDIPLDNGIATFMIAKQDLPTRIYSIMYAKMAILGCPISDCGYWPYTEWKKEFENFIIGVDSMGNERSFTCNPNCLNNLFNSNPSAIQYLTPVYFKREVLQKYYDAPKRYSVEDGVLRCSYKWLIYIDNQSPDYVSAYLGDLGRDLPSQQEQKHWRQYNIAIDGKLSQAKWGRDFGAQFTDPDSPVFQFQHRYQLVNKEFADHLGWELFLRLNKEDAYNFTGLRIPLSNQQHEFDMLVLSLVKVMIDSLNEKRISALNTDPSNDIKGSIARLEKMLITIGVNGLDVHIGFLRALQELRSTGTGHRKGKSYVKAASVFGLPGCDFSSVFGNILSQSVCFLDFIKGSIMEIADYQSSQAPLEG